MGCIATNGPVSVFLLTPQVLGVHTESVTETRERLRQCDKRAPDPAKTAESY